MDIRHVPDAESKMALIYTPDRTFKQALKQRGALFQVSGSNQQHGTVHHLQYPGSHAAIEYPG